MQSLQGRLLVTAASELDPDFVKAVILLIQHCPEQAVGVVLNRRSDSTIKELWKRAVKRPCELDGYVNCGGPVPGPPMAIHMHQPLGEIEVLPGVHYSVKKKNLEALGRLPGVQMKLFDSHAGWGPGQLERRIEQGAWRIVPATIESVFGGEDGLWDELKGI